MSAITPRSYKDDPSYSENLLPNSAIFPGDLVWDVAKESGDGNAIATNDPGIRYKSPNSLKIEVNDFIGTVSAPDAFTTTIPRTGNYIFAIRFFAEESFKTEECLCIGRIIKNVNDFVSDITVNIKEGEFYQFGKWNTFYEKFEMEEGDSIDIYFYLETQSTGIEFRIEAMKLELDDRDLGVPTSYTKPLV